MFKYLIAMCTTAILSTSIFISSIEAYPFNSKYEKEYKQRSHTFGVDLADAVYNKNYTVLGKAINDSCRDITLLSQDDGYYSNASPMYVASVEGDNIAVGMLEQCKGTTDNPYETILPAAKYKHYDLFKYFYGKWLGKKCSDDELYYYAVSGGSQEIIVFLQENGHKLNPNQPSLLNAAVMQPNINIVKVLLDAGADPNQVGYRGKSVEYPLVSCGYMLPHPQSEGIDHNYEAALLLLRHGANPFLPDPSPDAARCSPSFGSFMDYVTTYVENPYTLDRLLEAFENTNRKYKIEREFKYRYLRLLFEAQSRNYNGRTIDKENIAKLKKIVTLAIEHGAGIDSEVIDEAENLKSKELIDFLREYTVK